MREPQRIMTVPKQQTSPAALEAVDTTPNQGTSEKEGELLQALRRREESAFVALVDEYQSSLLRLAMFYVSNQAVASEVVQETWVGVLQGLDRFEGRSSLKTWIFRILINRAKTRAVREGRSTPFSALGEPDAEASEPSVDPERFLASDHSQWPGHWASPPQSWGDDPEKLLLANEVQAYLRKEIAALPASQRQVITLRDVEQWTSEEVCRVLGLSDTNQRVLLHRARSKVRAGLEGYFAGASKNDAQDEFPSVNKTV